MRGRHLLSTLPLIALLAGCGGVVTVHSGDDGGGGDDASMDSGESDGFPVDAPVTCGSGPCVEGTTCAAPDGCNTCSCTASGWACTLRDCPPDAGPACPPIEPKGGMVCTNEGQVCSYPNGCGSSDEAVCKGGYWSISGVTCTSMCPMSEPAVGSPCVGPNKCPYKGTCGEEIAYCDSAMSTWKIDRPTCTGPCPASEPMLGAPCPASGKCSYPTKCGTYDTVYCNGTGKVVSVDYGTCSMPTCPPTEPGAGTACKGPIKCAYTSACGAIDTVACNGTSGAWIVSAGPCPASCPPSKPVAGSKCSSSSLNCEWNNGCGNVVYGYCDTSFGWQLKDPGCTPGCPGAKPTTGTACMAGSSTCSYVVSSSCSTNCFCSDINTWACTPTSCTGGGGGFADAGVSDVGAPPPGP